MRAVIRRDNVKIEFTGRGQVWNELLRPYLGGPEAPSEEAHPAPAPTQAAERAAPVASPRPAVAYAPAAVASRPEPAAAQAVGYGGPARHAPGPSSPRTWYPPRREPAPAPSRFGAPTANHASAHFAPSPVAADDDEQDAVQVEPSSDPATLFARLAALPGRRSERDAVLASVWFLTRGDREVTADDVEAHFSSFSAFPDVKVLPHLLKHVHRTKTLEPGSNPKSFKLTRKGIASVRGRLVPN